MSRQSSTLLFAQTARSRSASIWSSFLAAALLSTARAQAQTPTSPPSSDRAPSRTQVIFGTVGIRAQEARGSLIALLAAQLGGLQLVLVEDEPSEPFSAWALRATRSQRVLAAVLLDGRSEHGWRLVIIDAARGRAIARALAGGVRNDAANVEAVVSISVSAASALREGLEVASTPVASVVGDGHRPRVPPPPLLSSRRPLTPSVTRAGNWAAQGVVGATVASFSPEAPTTQGLALGLGVSFRSHFEARMFGAFFIPPRIRGPLGEFSLARAFLGAAAGPVVGAPRLSFTPELGVVAERLKRYDANPVPGVFATESSSLYRLGGLLGFRLRHRIFAPLSVELAAGTMYFGRRLLFSAKGPETSWSMSVRPGVAFAQLGLQLATP